MMRTRSSLRRSSLRRAGLALASSMVAFFVAELGLRIARPVSLAIDHHPDIFATDPELGFRYVPGSESYIERHEFRVPIRINADGFFDDDFRLEREPGRRRIAAVGDSFTAGFHVGRGKNFPDLLERQLGAEVLNFGLIGTGTAQQAALVSSDVLAYRPDLLLLVFFANDVANVRTGRILRETYRGHTLIYLDPAQRPELAQRVDTFLEETPRWLRSGVRHSYVVRAAYAAWLARVERGEPTLLSNRVRAKGLQARDLPHGDAIAQIVELVCEVDAACDEIGADLLFVVVPSRQEVDETVKLAATPILRQLEARDVRTLSLLDAFQSRHRGGEELYWEHDDHCNEAGYALIASELHRHLLE